MVGVAHIILMGTEPAVVSTVRFCMVPTFMRVLSKFIREEVFGVRVIIE